MRRFLALVVVGLLAGACGDSSDTTSGTTARGSADTTSETTPGSSATSEQTTAPRSADTTSVAAAAPDTTAGSSASTSSSTSSGAPSERCLVRLHGKDGAGGEPSESDGVTILAPTGNADGWGAKQWLYFPDDQYDAARSIVADAVEPCEQVIVNGFSNGAAFAAKLYRRGETFDGRLVGVVVDDPRR
jgi:hypothetical protein